MIRVLALSIILLCYLSGAYAFTFHWELDKTPEGIESATVIKPVQVILLDEAIEVPSHSASLALMQKYSVYLDPEWDTGYAYRLLQTFESIPQETNNPYYEERRVEPSLWRLSDRHILNDIDVEYRDGQRIVTVSAEAFTYATPRLATIEGVRGRYFSKRLHLAVVRFVTENGVDRRALDKILEERYAVSVSISDYTELTRYTTGEHAGRFEDFKNEELIMLAAMLEEYPSGMLKTPGLKYLVRRLDGTPHPTYPTAAAVAWTGAGYIEFMEVAFKDTSADTIHRLILHEKAHFLWDYLFDVQLKQDWIQLGGWYENPDDRDGWSTTKQTEFVSTYAHGINPNEDMAESISYYIVNPDKLRSRSPAKYEFIQNRIMHGTRYISRIREDLTFQVYNLYPDYVYPGRVIRVDVTVVGEPEADKQLTIEIQLHHETDLDVATGGWINIFNKKAIKIGVSLYPVDTSGRRISASYILRGQTTISKYAADGYAIPDEMGVYDNVGHHRFSGNEFGLKIYIDNPLADCEPPEYVPNSLRLSLSDARTPQGQPYQLLMARWKLIEKNGLKGFDAQVDNDNPEHYSAVYGWSNKTYNIETGEVSVEIEFPDYWDSGVYAVHHIGMTDVAGNSRGVYFSQSPSSPWEYHIKIDELSPSIEILTRNPDTTAPEMNLNDISINAEPTRPKDPNGETRVDITFKVRDNISGYNGADIALRDPLGTMHWFGHAPHERGYSLMYFPGDPTVYETYQTTILLPVGSVPGTWGLAEMKVKDKARNLQRYDFTEIVRFEVTDVQMQAKYDLNSDGTVNILDLVIVSQEVGHPGGKNDGVNADLNADGDVNILDLVQIANQF